MADQWSKNQTARTVRANSELRTAIKGVLGLASLAAVAYVGLLLIGWMNHTRKYVGAVISPNGNLVAAELVDETLFNVSRTLAVRKLAADASSEWREVFELGTVGIGWIKWESDAELVVFGHIQDPTRALQSTRIEDFGVTVTVRDPRP